MLAGAVASASAAVCAQKKYKPRIVCNMYYWVQLFSTPYRYIASHPDPLKNSDRSKPLSQPAPKGGMVWTEEQWNSAFADVQYAGYSRMEMLSGTVLAKPVEDIKALLAKYGLRTQPAD